MTPPSESGSHEQTIGSYQIKRKLGAGGMGEVYLAYDKRLRRNVAIKRIRTGSSFSDEQRERLRREARAAAALSHPSIVQVFDILEDADGDSIVMEYVEGRTLWDLFNTGDLNGQMALDVLLQVADGLEAAHRRDLVHRDLKGENVIVNAAGDAKILDFGVAKSTDPSEYDQTLTTGGMAVGTYRSMSPEQCEAKAVDARADIFSFGVLMYEMFGGRSPFSGKTPLHTLANVVGFDPPPISELNGSVPGELSDLIESMLEKDPDKRPPSAAAVAARLETLDDPAILTRIVVPRLTPTPDSGIDPIRGAGTVGTRRRRTTRTAAPTPPRRRWGGVFAGIGIAAVAGVAYVAVQSSLGSETHNPNRIMVFPLAVSSGAELSGSAGEDVATMIGTVLDDTDPLQWIDAWPLLAPESRADIRSLQIDDMADLAAAEDAGYFIWGRVIPSGDSADVVLDLYESDGGRGVANARASGEIAVPWRAGLSAITELLPELITTAIPDVEADFGARPPNAVAELLEGERQFRRANIRTAREHFEHAFELDPTFALAGIRGAQAASWLEDATAAREMLEAVLELPLRPKSAAFVSGLLAYVDLDAEGAVQHLRAALEEDSTLAVAWAALGEVYRHRAPRDPWLEGPRPFARALAIDSTAANLLYHRLEEVMRDGDLDTATRLSEQYFASDPDFNLAHQIDVMLRCLSDGPASSDWEDDVLLGSAQVEFAAGQFLIGGRNLPCAETLMRAVMRYDTTTANAEGRYWAGLLGVAGSHAVQGQFEDVRRLVTAASQGYEVFQPLIDNMGTDASGLVLPPGDPLWVGREGVLRSDHEDSLTRWSEFAVFLGTVYPQLEDLGELGAADLRQNMGPGLSGPSAYRTSILMLGIWDAYHGRLEEAAFAAERLREEAAGYDPGVDRDYSFRLADALDAHRLLGAGEEDQALAALRALTVRTREGVIFVELPGAQALERLTQARLEERIGDPERALNLVLSFDEPSALPYIVSLPPGLATCVRTANRIGQTARARECEARLSRLGWSLEDL